MKKIIYFSILLTFLTACALPFGSGSAPAATAPPVEPSATAESTATTAATATELPSVTASVEAAASLESSMTVQVTDAVTTTPSATPTATGKPTATLLPTASATPTRTATPTVTPSPTLSSVGVTNRCQVLSGFTLTFITLDWIYGEPLTFYLKIPGGVPGLEKPLSGDSGVWSYYATIRQHRTQECKFIPGYAERLYCTIDLPTTYNNTLQVLNLFVNGCDAAIYQEPLADMPKFVFKRNYPPGNSGDNDPGE